MIIISDTTPLRYLIEIQATYILERLFGEVLIPEKVAQELQRPKTPQPVKDWIQTRPVWLKVSKADTSLFVPKKRIGDGEREAFALAVEFEADAVLVDDRDAAMEANSEAPDRSNSRTPGLKIITIFKTAFAY